MNCMLLHVFNISAASELFYFAVMLLSSRRFFFHRKLCMLLALSWSPIGHNSSLRMITCQKQENSKCWFCLLSAMNYDLKFFNFLLFCDICQYVVRDNAKEKPTYILATKRDDHTREKIIAGTSGCSVSRTCQLLLACCNCFFFSMLILMTTVSMPLPPNA